MFERIRTRRAAASADDVELDEARANDAPHGGDPFAVGYLAAVQAGPGAVPPTAPPAFDDQAVADFASGFLAYSELFAPGLPLQISGYRAAGIRSIDSPFTSPDDVEAWIPRGMTAADQEAFEEGWRSYWNRRPVPGPRPGTPAAGQKMLWLTPPSGPSWQEVTVIEVRPRAVVDITDAAGRRHRTHLGTLAFPG